jgi:hypothetical protein
MIVGVCDGAVVRVVRLYRTTGGSDVSLRPRLPRPQRRRCTKFCW